MDTKKVISKALPFFIFIAKMIDGRIIMELVTTS